MKASNIQVGNLYEVKSGHNVTVVKAKAINEKTDGWGVRNVEGQTNEHRRSEAFREGGHAKEGKSSCGEVRT